MLARSGSDELSSWLTKLFFSPCLHGRETDKGETEGCTVVSPVEHSFYGMRLPYGLTILISFL